ncbi:MAG: hypothetical protein ACXWJM_17565 [Ramlibacter sp.]
MKLIATKQGKTDKYDELRCIRRDGSESSCPMPRQGILPHDLVHYVVETGLGWKHGFLGQVAAGRDISFAAEYAHDPGNREAADQVVQAEAVVESLQAQLWSGAFDGAMFMEGVRGACEVRGRGMPDLSGVDAEAALFRRALELGARWQQVPFHGSLELEMEHV